MSKLLIVQLVVSFFSGGLLINILTLIAEKTNQHISGIIMMFPSTIALGFLFLGLTTNAQSVSTVIPASIIPLGIVTFSPVIYIYCSLFFAAAIKNKTLQIVCSLLISVLGWFILAAPFAAYKLSNILLAIPCFFVLVTMTHFILNNKKPALNFTRPAYTKLQIILRGVFTGSVIAMLVFSGKTLNPFWGGLFTMFPAATFTTLTVLHFYYEPVQLFYFIKAAPLGSISLFIYTVSVMWFFPLLGIWSGTLVSYCISLAFGLLLIKLKKIQMVKNYSII
jgi:uncharacterized membrane protein (GlpM family)